MHSRVNVKEGERERSPREGKERVEEKGSKVGESMRTHIAGRGLMRGQSPSEPPGAC